MHNIPFFIGPMSKNIVDAILEYIDETGNQIGFIPSRRQIEYLGVFFLLNHSKQFVLLVYN